MFYFCVLKMECTANTHINKNMQAFLSANNFRHLLLLSAQANVAVQESRLKVANNELRNAQALLAEKQAEFDKVTAKYDAAMKEKQVSITLFRCVSVPLAAG